MSANNKDLVMFKQLIALIAFSVGIIFAMEYAQQGVHLLVNAHDWVSKLLIDVFSGGQAGNMARGLIALLSIPVLIGMVPAIAYWFVRRHWFPYFMQIVWVVWLVQIGALVMLYKAASLS
jgi:hypothetical protein